MRMVYRPMLPHRVVTGRISKASASNNLQKSDIQVIALKSFYSFLQNDLGNSFLPHASILSPKIGNNDVGCDVNRCYRGEHAGKVIITQAIDAENLESLKAFVTEQVSRGMLIAERNDKIYVIDPKL